MNKKKLLLILSLFVILMTVFGSTSAQDSKVPAFKVSNVIQDEKVILTTKDFPADTNYVISMASPDTPEVFTPVAKFNSKTGGSLNVTIKIPGKFQGLNTIELMMKDSDGKTIMGNFVNIPVEEPVEEPVQEEPAETPAEEPVKEEPAETPAEEPVKEEPAETPAEEPVQDETISLVNQGTTEEQPAAEQPAEEQPTEEQPAEEKPAEEQPAEEQPTEEQTVEEQPTEEQPAEEQPTEEQPTEEQTVEEQPTEEQPAEEQPTEEQPTEEQPTEEQTVEEQPTEEQPTEEQPAEEQLAEEQPAEEQPAAEADNTDTAAAEEETAPEEIPVLVCNYGVIPYTVINSVEKDTSVTFTTNNFPADSTFTVSMGVYVASWAPEPMHPRHPGYYPPRPGRPAPGRPEPGRPGPDRPAPGRPGPEPSYYHSFGPDPIPDFRPEWDFDRHHGPEPRGKYTTVFSGSPVGSFETGSGEPQTLTFEIPAELKGTNPIALWIEDQGVCGFYSYNYFYNNTTLW